MSDLVKVVILGGMVLGGSLLFGAESDLESRIARLEALVKSQQQEIQSLRATATPKPLVSPGQAKELEGVIDDRIAAGLAALRDEERLHLRDELSGLTFKSDGRFRYQSVDADPGFGGTTNDLYRLRLRLGAVWENDAGNWEFGAGIEVGSSNARSGNTTLSNSPRAGASTAFESESIYLDYAYARHKLANSSFTLGQAKNPFETTDVMWDSDIRPVGAFYQFADFGVFLNSGIMVASEAGSDAEALLGGLQAGFGRELEDYSWSLAIGYMHGNNELASDAGVSTDFDFQVVDALLKYERQMGEVTFDTWWHLVKNLGADGAAGTGQQGGAIDPDDESLAYVIGARAGYDRFKLGYAYKHIEADAVVASLNDSNFGLEVGSTNVKGHELWLDVKLMDSVKMRLGSHFFEQVVGSAEGELYQLDLSYKF